MYARSPGSRKARVRFAPRPGPGRVASVLDHVTVETFAPAIGEPFALGGAATGRLELEEAAAVGSPAPGGRAPFRLVFRGPVDPVLPQRIYRLEHPSTGALEIFLVPIGRDEAGTRYEAIFA